MLVSALLGVRESEWVGRASLYLAGIGARARVTWCLALVAQGPSPNPPSRAWAVAVSLLPGSSKPHRQAGPDDIVCGYFYPVTFLSLAGG